MCAVAIPLIAAGVGAAATIYSARQASSDASAARAQTEQQMQMAKEQASQPTAATQTATDVTAARQAAQRRAAVASGMTSTITGAGAQYSTQASGLGVGTKKQLGA